MLNGKHVFLGPLAGISKDTFLSRCCNVAEAASAFSSCRIIKVRLHEARLFCLELETSWGGKGAKSPRERFLLLMSDKSNGAFSVGDCSDHPERLTRRIMRIEDQGVLTRREETEAEKVKLPSLVSTLFSVLLTLCLKRLTQAQDPDVDSCVVTFATDERRATSTLVTQPNTCGGSTNPAPDTERSPTRPGARTETSFSGWVCLNLTQQASVSLMTSCLKDSF